MVARIGYLLLTIKWIENNQNADIMWDFDDQVFENIFNDNVDDKGSSHNTLFQNNGFFHCGIFRFWGVLIYVTVQTSQFRRSR